jgi:hypothetical protein
VPPFFCQQKRRQAERQEDQHEGRAHPDHLHAVTLGIGVVEQEHGEEDQEQGMGRHDKKSAGAQTAALMP